VLVVLVQGHQGLVQAEVVQQGAALAGVLAGHGIHQAQHVDGAQAEVGQIAYGRGHQVKGAGGILLGTGRALGGLTKQGGIDVQVGLSGWTQTRPWA